MFAAPILTPGILHLKYLFTAQFKDGSIFVQTQDDLHPRFPNRNAYYELLICDESGIPIQYSDDHKVVTRSDIELFQLEDTSHRYLVDLRDGHFEIQHIRGKQSLVGVPFFVEIPPVNTKLKLFYFKRRRHNFNVSGIVQEDLSINATQTKEISQECEYHFGWETEDRKHKAEIILV